MQSRIRHVSYVTDFLDHGFDATQIGNLLKAEADLIISHIEFKDLVDWEVQFRATYTNAKQLLISKSKLGTYPSDKYKEITVPIPIPTIDKVWWGVRKEQHVYKEDHYDKIISNFNALEVDFLSFKNRTDYITDCIRRAIIFSFVNGFTINGVKIKSLDLISR